MWLLTLPEEEGPLWQLQPSPQLPPCCVAQVRRTLCFLGPLFWVMSTEDTFKQEVVKFQAAFSVFSVTPDTPRELRGGHRHLLLKAETSGGES